MSAARESKLKRADLPAAVCLGLLLASLLLPLAQFDLQSPSSLKLEATDASEWGLGLAWTRAEFALAHEMARKSDH
eukprot:6609393-Alexandrium_andersonii.AAC.1